MPAPGRPLGRCAQAQLAAEILATYLRVRLALRRHPLPAVLAALRRSPGAPAELSCARGRRLGEIVTRALQLLPTDGRCLVRSLVLLALLARRGIATTLVLGVAPGGGLAAHAWVEHEGAPLLPSGGDHFGRLAEL